MLFFSDLRRHGSFKSLWFLLYGSGMLWTCWGISVSFPYKSIYVAPGKMLVLQAQITRSPTEVVRLVTWDLKNSKGELRLDTNKSPDPDNVRWQIDSVTDEKYGFYIVTVTDHNGDQTFTSIDVRKITTPPQASLSLQCSIKPEGTLWDRPVFSWWVNGTEVTNQTASLSSDGSRLHLTPGNLDNNYTCVISNIQGTSQVQVIREAEPAPEPCPNCSGLITFAVIEGVVIVGMLIFFLRPRIKRWCQKSQDSQNHINNQSPCEGQGLNCNA